MVNIEAVAGSLVVEGELVFEEADEACMRLEKALDGLLRSRATIPTVDLTRVSAVSCRAAELLFTLWLDLLLEGRALLLLAPDQAWEMLGRAAVDRALAERATDAARPVQVAPGAQREMPFAAHRLAGA
ncbi:MAG: hypothetical protein ACYSU0_20265 [Planctomycetota bacterium]|jgi:hypothetical protein